ncbi:MAG: HEAT repeat domain-containing protein, partial [Phycisphaerae bacterium]
HQVEVAGVLSPVRVELSDGREAWLPAIGGLTAPPLRFRRSAWAVSPERMRSLLRQAQSPAVSDRITAMEILSMLLGEQQHLAAGRLRYAAVPIDAGQVQQAILARSADADWSVRARLAECLRWFVLDAEATRAAANLLTDDHWLVRGLALRLFADQHKDSFLPALRQIAGADPDEWVRRMARALADRMPTPATQPTAPASTASP